MKHTLEALQAWLDDEDNYFEGSKHTSDSPEINSSNLNRTGFEFYGVRLPFKCFNGTNVSIQQSASHYCSPSSVEMWNCPHLDMLDSYGSASDPYGYVPLEVVVVYLNELEKLPPKSG